MQILDRYIVRIFLSTLGLVLFFVLGIYVVIDLLAKADSVLEARAVLAAHGRSAPGVLAEYYLRSVPFIYLRLAPFLTLIAATVAVLRLMRSNELTPMVAAGRSPLRIALPLFVCAALLSVTMLAVQEWVVPRQAAARDRLEDMVRGDFRTRADDLSGIRDAAGSTWHIEYFYPREKRIEGVRVLRFRPRPGADDEGVLTLDSATWREDGPGGPGWYPVHGVVSPAGPDAGFLSPRPLPPDRPFETALTLEQVHVEYLRQAGDPSMNLSLTEAARIARQYPGVPEPAVVFHQLLTWPIANLLLMLLGLPLVLRFRNRNLLFGIGSALLLCAAYFAVTQICQDLGKRGEVGPAVAVWFPVVLFSSVAAAIVDYQRGARPRGIPQSAPDDPPI